MDYIVEFKNVTKRFPGIVANDDVSFGIKEGEIFAVLGENGAGKSTLMSVLFGMYEPDEGEVYVRGEKVETFSPSHASELNIGMVHQHFNLVSDYTVTENIVMGVEPKTRLFGLLPVVDMKSAEKAVKELAERYSLDVDPQKTIDQLPVSTQQRVEILKMLYREADILIFDEPTAVLTPQEIEVLLDTLREMKKKGKTIILITHKLDEIKKVADRCAVLNRGRLINICEVADTSAEELAKMMVGRDVNFTVEKPETTFGDVLLEVNNLTVFNSDKVKLVDDVSFKVHAGEIYAIAGVAGNGQVEIADAVAGLMPVSAGKITLNGTDITNLPVRKRINSGLAYIPEDRHSTGMILDFTLADNLLLKRYHEEPYCVNGVLHPEKVYEKSDKLIDAFDIRSGQGSATTARSMSGGNQQKAIVAREIDLDTPVIIFVQPTRGLDIGAIEMIHSEILNERAKGKAILLVSLELDEIMTLADTIGVIYNGKFLKEAPAESLTKEDVGQYMMGVVK